MTHPARTIIGLSWMVVMVGILLNPVESRGQNSISGFYVLLAVKKNCPNQLSTRDGTKTYCLTTEPVIPESDFELIGDVQFDSLLLQKYFVLRLTNNGFSSFKFMVNRLPDAKLVLVIDELVAGVFDHVDKNIGRSIPIRGNSNTAGIDWIHDRLKGGKQKQ